MATLRPTMYGRHHVYPPCLQTPYKCMLHTQCIKLPSKTFTALRGWSAVSQPLHNCITPALYLPDQSWSASATPDSLFSFPNSSAATGLSPAEGSGGKCTYQGAQEVPLQLQQVCNVCIVYMRACEQCCRVCNSKCIMRSSEVPLISLCLMVSVTTLRKC